MDKIPGLQQIALQVAAAHMIAVIKGPVGSIDVRLGAAHGDRWVLRLIIALPDLTAEVVEIAAAHDGRCAAAQADRFNAAVGKLLLSFGRLGVRVGASFA